MKITFKGIEYLPLNEYAKKWGVRTDSLRQKRASAKSIPTILYGDTIFIRADFPNNSIKHHNFEKFPPIKADSIEIDGETFVSSTDAMKIAGVSRVTLLYSRKYTRIKIGHSNFIKLSEL